MKKPVPLSTPLWSSCLADTPLGPLVLTFTSQGLAALSFGEEAISIDPDRPLPPSLEPLRDATINALTDYFAAIPSPFQALSLDLQGTPFQLRVWQELRQIPSGTTVSYQALAIGLGNPRAPRAVGQALAANPLPIIIPCHRVIAKDGSLGGYSSGLDRKRWLLQHEGVLF